MKIETSYDRPPIPTTACDWSAWDADTSDGAEDSGRLAHIVGRGPTERAALIDLIEQTVDYWRDLAETFAPPDGNRSHDWNPDPALRRSGTYCRSCGCAERTREARQGCAHKQNRQGIET
jgi:hypothetical protein